MKTIIFVSGMSFIEAATGFLVIWIMKQISWSPWGGTRLDPHISTGPNFFNSVLHTSMCIPFSLHRIPPPASQVPLYSCVFTLCPLEHNSVTTCIKCYIFPLSLFDACYCYF